MWSTAIVQQIGDAYCEQGGLVLNYHRINLLEATQESNVLF